MSQCQPLRDAFFSVASVEPMSGQHDQMGCFANVEGAMQDVAGSTRQSEPSDERLLRDYLASRDAGAFAAIVRRHGSLVSGVCRRVLEREQDVEDAFQATFLVLVRKAHCLARPNLLGNWLYGVAYRIASKIRSANLRQRMREAPMVDLPAAGANDDAAGRDLRPVLDDELQRLPERYRRPLVLFYLEGKSTEEVASALGRPRGTVLSQLARARERLRMRLSRRKLILPVGLLLALLESVQSADAAVPDRLFDLGMQTVRASEADVSAQARLLARLVLKDMLRRRLWTIGSLVAAVLLAPAAGCLSYRALQPLAPAVTKSDLEALQGDWQVVAVVQDGRELPKDQFPFATLRIENDTILHEGGPHQGLKVRIRLHPEQQGQPGAIDMWGEGYHAEIYNGIYSLAADTLTICRLDESQPSLDETRRPAEFSSQPGSKRLLYVGKRIPPAGP
jgi:RNA polymerase sigma factor (sigma-70 family)